MTFQVFQATIMKNARFWVITTVTFGCDNYAVR
jgi:hypothetical protein